QWAGLFGHKGIESLGFRGHLTLDFPTLILAMNQTSTSKLIKPITQLCIGLRQNPHYQRRHTMPLNQYNQNKCKPRTCMYYLSGEESRKKLSTYYKLRKICEMYVWFSQHILFFS
ncbi:hypothetical protein, partial [Bacteroides nordii]|uniref:hypothetical protein n=1 Tax=Bacteroides nordii TaxID=291645 RepID=UPI001D02D5DA